LFDQFGAGGGHVGFDLFFVERHGDTNLHPLLGFCEQLFIELQRDLRDFDPFDRPNQVEISLLRSGHGLDDLVLQPNSETRIPRLFELNGQTVRIDPKILQQILPIRDARCAAVLVVGTGLVLVPCGASTPYSWRKVWPTVRALPKGVRTFRKTRPQHRRQKPRFPGPTG